jgi:hypothetical protein
MSSLGNVVRYCFLPLLPQIIVATLELWERNCLSILREFIVAVLRFDVKPVLAEKTNQPEFSSSLRSG